MSSLPADTQGLSFYFPVHKEQFHLLKCTSPPPDGIIPNLHIMNPVLAEILFYKLQALSE